MNNRWKYYADWKAYRRIDSDGAELRVWEMDDGLWACASDYKDQTIYGYRSGDKRTAYSEAKRLVGILRKALGGKEEAECQ